MKNDLIELQNRIFDLFDDLKAMDLEDKNLKLAIEKHLALDEIAKTALLNGALMVKAADTLYGLPVSEELPLIPPSKAESPVIGFHKKRQLVNLPKVGRVLEV